MSLELSDGVGLCTRVWWSLCWAGCGPQGLRWSVFGISPPMTSQVAHWVGSHTAEVGWCLPSVLRAMGGGLLSCLVLHLLPLWPGACCFYASLITYICVRLMLPWEDNLYLAAQGVLQLSGPESTCLLIWYFVFHRSYHSSNCTPQGTNLFTLSQNTYF